MLTIDRSKLNPAFLKQWEKKIRADQRKIERKAMQFVKREAKTLAPKRTGALRKSIETVPVSDGFYIGSRCPYAGYQEYGTSKIVPKAFLRRAIAALILVFKQFGLGK